MVVKPGAMGVARPLLLTVATDVFDEVQVTCVVKSRVVKSENLPLAVYCWLSPIGMVRLPGAIEGAPRLPGVTDMLVNSACSHAVRDTAKNPRKKIARTNRIFFTKTPPGKKLPIWVCPGQLLEIHGQFRRGADRKYLGARRLRED